MDIFLRTLLNIGRALYTIIIKGGITLRRLLSIFLCCLVILVMGRPVYAQNDQNDFNYVPQEVQQAAAIGLKTFSKVINNQKTRYGLSDTDNAASASLGKGHVVYHMSVNTVRSYISGKITTPPSSKLFRKENLYVFPVNVGNKTAGVLFVANFDGKWQAVRLTSYLGFENDLKNAEDIVGTLPSSSSEKLVFDQAMHLIALLVEGPSSDFMVPLQNNNTLAIEKCKKILVKDVVSKVSKSFSNTYSNNNKIYGSVGVIGAGIGNIISGWLPLIIIILGVIVVNLGKKGFACRNK